MKFLYYDHRNFFSGFLLFSDHSSSSVIFVDAYKKKGNESGYGHYEHAYGDMHEMSYDASGIEVPKKRGRGRPRGSRRLARQSAYCYCCNLQDYVLLDPFCTCKCVVCFNILPFFFIYRRSIR